MACRNATFEVEQIEQLALIDLLPTHHDPPPPLTLQEDGTHDSPMFARDFLNSIDPERTLGGHRARGPLCAQPKYQPAI
jgi:hypothetical protein